MFRNVHILGCSIWHSVTTLWIQGLKLNWVLHQIHVLPDFALDSWLTPVYQEVRWTLWMFDQKLKIIGEKNSHSRDIWSSCGPPESAIKRAHATPKMELNFNLYKYNMIKCLFPMVHAALFSILTDSQKCQQTTILKVVSGILMPCSSRSSILLVMHMTPSSSQVGPNVL